MTEQPKPRTQRRDVSGAIRALTDHLRCCGLCDRWTVCWEASYLIDIVDIKIVDIKIDAILA